jgi:hypothetical protein
VVVQGISLLKRTDRVDREECECAESGPVDGSTCGCRPADGDPGEDRSDAGMSTVEYAVGTVVAAAFAAVLYQIVTGDSVVSGLTDLINRALSTSF